MRGLGLGLMNAMQKRRHGRLGCNAIFAFYPAGACLLHLLHLAFGCFGRRSLLEPHTVSPVHCECQLDTTL